MAFFQDPPTLGNQYDDDRVLKSYLARTLPNEAQPAAAEKLRAMGELTGGELFRLQQQDRLNEPTLTQWDAWGHRVDRIELTPLWKRAQTVAAEHGVVAAAYDGELGPLDRVEQFALVYLFDPSSDTYTCPLAMTDGAARTLLAHADHAEPLVARAVARLTSRDPSQMWTSGQWMTERTGGSDVGLSETRAEPLDQDAYGMPGAHRLFGTKWFTSAATSEMALTLARPDGEPEGGRGLTLFYLEMKDAEGRSNGILVNRLKDKLGTKKLPTAELTLDGAVAVPVAGIGHGIRNITPMLNVTRTWNAVSSVAAMRRGLALARDYARRRVQFGAPLSEKPLHLDTLAGLAAETEAAFLLAFRTVELLGRAEHPDAEGGSERDEPLLRLLTPVAKLVTAKQAVAVSSEVLECFGGAGYVEDAGVARLLRDAQVLPIWEGTTNVLSLDLLRALSRGAELGALVADVEDRLAAMKDVDMKAFAQRAIATLGQAGKWLKTTADADRLSVEAGARRFALTVGRSYQLALLAHHADWCLQHQQDGRSAQAARRFASHGIDHLRTATAPDRDATAALAMG